jgi:hypothetical protein
MEKGKKLWNYVIEVFLRSFTFNMMISVRCYCFQGLKISTRSSYTET